MFETILSVFHKMALTVLKVSFKEQKPKVLNDQKYQLYEKNISQEQFLQN